MTATPDVPEPYGSIIDRLADVRIVVVGDLVLDRFVYGQTGRISREAPVLVLEQSRVQEIPGGAGNTMMNLAALDVTVFAIGVTGADAAGATIRQHLADAGVMVDGLFALESTRTSTKTRILGSLRHGAMQQIVRVDDHAPLDRDDERDDGLLAALDAAFDDGVTAAIVSDYDGGVATPRMREALAIRAGGGATVVADARTAVLDYTGFTSATPNISELEAALGREIEDDAQRLDVTATRVHDRLGLETLLVTRGKLGMSLFSAVAMPVTIPVVGPDEVTDVTGAGDTVIAVFTAARAAGADWEAAARLANVAAGNVVQKAGTATLSRDELRGDCARYL